MIRVLNTEVERNSKIYLITTTLFRMPGKACHTHQVIVTRGKNVLDQSENLFTFSV